MPGRVDEKFLSWSIDFVLYFQWASVSRWSVRFNHQNTTRERKKPSEGHFIPLRHSCWCSWWSECGFLDSGSFFFINSTCFKFFQNLWLFPDDRRFRVGFGSGNFHDLLRNHSTLVGYGNLTASLLGIFNFKLFPVIAVANCDYSWRHYNDRVSQFEKSSWKICKLLWRRLNHPNRCSEIGNNELDDKDDDKEPPYGAFVSFLQHQLKTWTFDLRNYRYLRWWSYLPSCIRKSERSSNCNPKHQKDLSTCFQILHSQTLTGFCLTLQQLNVWLKFQKNKIFTESLFLLFLSKNVSENHNEIPTRF